MWECWLSDSFLVVNSDCSPAEAEQVLRQVLLPTEPLDKKDKPCSSRQAPPWLKHSETSRPVMYHRANPQENQKGSHSIQHSCLSGGLTPVLPALLHVDGPHPAPGMILFLIYRISPILLREKKTHNSFIYSTMSAASVTKLPFPFCRIPVVSFRSYSLST